MLAGYTGIALYISLFLNNTQIKRAKRLASATVAIFDPRRSLIRLAHRHNASSDRFSHTLNNARAP